MVCGDALPLNEIPLPFLINLRLRPPWHALRGPVRLPPLAVIRACWALRLVTHGILLPFGSSVAQVHALNINQGSLLSRRTRATRMWATLRWAPTQGCARYFALHSQSGQ